MGGQERSRLIMGLKGQGGCGSIFLVGMDGVDKVHLKLEYSGEKLRLCCIVIRAVYCVMV